ncbi:MAG: alpha/beta hydrolase [Parafilimonas sp.]
MKTLQHYSLRSFFVLTLIFLFFSCSKNNTLTTRGVGNGNGGGNPDVKVVSNLQYGAAKDMQGNMVNLALDIYIPANATASDKFPFIFFVHGGGFTAGDKISAANALTTFAESGFVGVSIDYRLDSSIDANTTDPCSVDSTIIQEAVYMSVQDAKAAMRYMVANAAKYNIDTSRILLDGNSAGAITILNSYYLTQSDFNKLIPGVETRLGGVDNSDNSYTNTFSVIGIAANSGCLPNPDYITSSNVVPTIYFNGGEDSVIPAKQGHAYYCPNTIYVYGSETLYQRVLDLGAPAVIHIDPTGGHGPYTEDFLTSNEICFFNSLLSKKSETGSFSGQVSSCQ